jgi:hypothetical protein
MRDFMKPRVLLAISMLLLVLQGCSNLRFSNDSGKSLMHVFAYTPVEGATQQDFINFTKATHDLVGKIPGLKRVWVGKLREPIPGENDKPRTFGVAMEFENEDALKVYATHPAHDQWVRVYEKVRVPGTTTLDIMGE